MYSVKKTYLYFLQVFNLQVVYLHFYFTLQIGITEQKSMPKEIKAAGNRAYFAIQNVFISNAVSNVLKIRIL